jgi:hypothetical protein
MTFTIKKPWKGKIDRAEKQKEEKRKEEEKQRKQAEKLRKAEEKQNGNMISADSIKSKPIFKPSMPIANDRMANPNEKITFQHIYKDELLETTCPAVIVDEDLIINQSKCETKPIGKIESDSTPKDQVPPIERESKPSISDEIESVSDEENEKN